MTQVPVQLDENFLNDLGIGSLPEEQKRAFAESLLETLQLRLQNRLGIDMDEAQTESFAMLALDMDKLPESDVEGKQRLMQQWLAVNRPDYKEMAAEELGKMKEELLVVSNVSSSS